MTRKTTRYTRKRGLKQGQYIEPGHSWITAIERCRPFDAEPVVKGLQGTDVNATGAALDVRTALDSLLSHQVPPEDGAAFTLLAHAVDVAHIRALQIQPDDSNPAHHPLLAAKAALQQVRERHHRLGRWGVSSTDRLALTEAVEIYETILTSSSPQQMQDAVEVRVQALQRGQIFQLETTE